MSDSSSSNCVNQNFDVKLWFDHLQTLDADSVFNSLCGLLELLHESMGVGCGLLCRDMLSKKMLVPLIDFVSVFQCRFVDQVLTFIIKHVAQYTKTNPSDIELVTKAFERPVFAFMTKNVESRTFHDDDECVLSYITTMSQFFTYPGFEMTNHEIIKNALKVTHWHKKTTLKKEIYNYHLYTIAFNLKIYGDTFCKFTPGNVIFNDKQDMYCYRDCNVNHLTYKIGVWNLLSAAFENKKGDDDDSDFFVDDDEEDGDDI